MEEKEITNLWLPVIGWLATFGHREQYEHSFNMQVATRKGLCYLKPNISFKWFSLLFQIYYKVSQTETVVDTLLHFR